MFTRVSVWCGREAVPCSRFPSGDSFRFISNTFPRRDCANSCNRNGQTRVVTLVVTRVRGLTQKTEDAMKNLALKVQRFLVSEDGPTAVEYAVMLALIVIVCLTAITSIGTKASAVFQSVATSLSTAS